MLLLYLIHSAVEETAAAVFNAVEGTVSAVVSFAVEGTSAAVYIAVEGTVAAVRTVLLLKKLLPLFLML